MSKEKSQKETTKPLSKSKRPEFPEDRIEKGGWIKRNKQNEKKLNK